MRKRFLTFVFFVVIATAFAQKPPMKFGDIPMEDMKMTVYDKDSSASAVILFEYGETHVDVTSRKTMFRRHKRIKILKSGAFTQADVRIGLNTGYDNITGLKAITYNLEGDKIVETEVDKSNIFFENINKYVKSEKFTMPGVKEGSIIEFTYLLTSSLIFYPQWEFQARIPSRWSELWVNIPTTLRVEKYMQGYLTPAVYENSPKVAYQIPVDCYHFVFKDIPAFKPEPQMTNANDYISKINFQLIGTSYNESSWEKVAERLLKSESFGLVVKNSGFLQEKVDTIVAGKTDDMEKIKAIHTYVKEKIKWDETSDFSCGNVKKILEDRRGSSGEINLILGSMLNKAGFHVDMILLSTRDHGFIRKQTPMTRQFNYAVCGVMVKDKYLLVDATEKYLAAGILPERCFNGEGLIISETRSGWADIKPKTKSRTVISADLNLTPEAELKGIVTISKAGYDAERMRVSYFKKGEDEYIKDFVGSKPWTLNSKEFSNLRELESPVIEKYDVTMTESVTVAADIVYLNPYLSFRHTDNPFKSEKREYPVDYGVPFEQLNIIKFSIPDGYVLDEIPKSQIFMMPDNAARYSYSITQLGNTVSLTSNFQINRSLYTMEDYPHLREFYSHVVAKQEEQIVLKKK